MDAQHHLTTGFQGVVSRRSIVRPTAPSVEFSDGTDGVIGNGRPRPSRKTSSMDESERQQAGGMAEMLGSALR